MSLANSLRAQIVYRTILFDNLFGVNLSDPSDWRPRFTSVSVTDLAFLENQRVRTMIIPAARSKYVFVLTGSFRIDMPNASGSVPEPFQARKDSRPAMGTPMKFTRSFPAKAIASAKVPNNTTNFRIFHLNTVRQTCITTVQKANAIPNRSRVLPVTHFRNDSEINDAPLTPLISKKYVSAERARPDQTPPTHWMRFLTWNEKRSLEKYWTILPTTKAINTERNIPDMMINALDELM